MVATIVGVTLVPTLRAEAATCGVPITRSITLTSDLVCSGSGLIVGADSIVVDLGGHLVSGTTGDGIDTDRHSRVVIRNGTVSGFTWGVGVDGSHNTVRGLDVGGAAEGIVVSGSHQKVIGNVLEHSSDAGVTLGATHSSVSRNLARANGVGFVADSGSCCAFDGNVAIDNAIGFQNYTTHTSFTHDSAMRNSGVGFVFYSAPGRVSSDVALDNGDTGFRFAASKRAMALTSNVANRNGFAGGGADGNGAGFEILMNSGPLPRTVSGNIASSNDDSSNCAPTSICSYPGPVLPVEAPPACGSTITHSTEFAASKDCTGSDGYVIGADDIVVDLGGHEVGSNDSTHTGFNVNGHSSVTIRNGTIDNFATDLFVDAQSPKATIQGIIATRGFAGFDLRGDGTRAFANVASTNEIGFAIEAPFGRTMLVRNAALSTSSVGYYVSGDSCCVTFKGNLAGVAPTLYTGNHEGFDLEGKKMTISNNIALSSFANGFAIDVPTKHEIVAANTAFLNGGDGFNISSSKRGLKLVRNVADINGFQGSNSDGLGRGFELGSMTGVVAAGNIAADNDDPSECSPQARC